MVSWPGLPDFWPLHQHQSILSLLFIYLCLETECLLSYIRVGGSAFTPLGNNEFLPVPGEEKDGCPVLRGLTFGFLGEKSLSKGTRIAPHSSWSPDSQHLQGSCLQSPACLWPYMHLKGYWVYEFLLCLCPQPQPFQTLKVAPTSL